VSFVSRNVIFCKFSYKSRNVGTPRLKKRIGRLSFYILFHIVFDMHAASAAGVMGAIVEGLSAAI